MHCITFSRPSNSTPINATNVQYHFGYEVNAPETGDKKHHIETRINNQVRGSYSITEPNGAHRFIEYIANGSGFNARVHQEYRSKNYQMPIYSYRQSLHTNVLFQRNKNQVQLSEKQRLAFEKLLNQRKYIQSSPRAISTRNYLESKLPKSIDGGIRTRQQQYEVTESNQDIDIRRSVNKSSVNN